MIIGLMINKKEKIMAVKGYLFTKAKDKSGLDLITIYGH